MILGVRIDWNEHGDITLSQKAYSECLLKHFNMHLCSPLTTPLPCGLSLSTEDCLLTSAEEEKMRKIPYREALGLLMWL